MPQALRKVKQTPKYQNRRAQLVVEWEAKNKNGSGSGSSSSSGRAALAGKPTRRGKAKTKGSSLPEDAEKAIDDQMISEVRLRMQHLGPSFRTCAGLATL